MAKTGGHVCLASEPAPLSDAWITQVWASTFPPSQYDARR